VRTIHGTRETAPNVRAPTTVFSHGLGQIRTSRFRGENGSLAGYIIDVTVQNFFAETINLGVAWTI